MGLLGRSARGADSCQRVVASRYRLLLLPVVAYGRDPGRVAPASPRQRAGMLGVRQRRVVVARA